MGRMTHEQMNRIDEHLRLTALDLDRGYPELAMERITRFRSELAADRPTAVYSETFCSSCGAAFGPGPHGFSHCDQHEGKAGKK